MFNADGASLVMGMNLSGNQTEEARRIVACPLFGFWRGKEAAVPTMIPTFLLKKLYVKGSFRNTANGFQLALRNTLANGTLTGVGAIQLDGREIPRENIWIVVNDGAPIRASEISFAVPRLFPLDATVTFRVEDQPLAPGAHHVQIVVDTREAGELRIDAEDSIE